jgi:hypothetical protein
VKLKKNDRYAEYNKNRNRETEKNKNKKEIGKIKKTEK